MTDVGNRSPADCFELRCPHASAATAWSWKLKCVPKILDQSAPGRTVMHSRHNKRVKLSLVEDVRSGHSSLTADFLSRADMVAG